MWHVCGLFFAVVMALASCGGEPGPKTCSAQSDCLDGYDCDATSSQCRRSCTTNSNCLDSEFCDTTGGTAGGICRFGQPGGDPAGGDPAGGDPTGGD